MSTVTASHAADVIQERLRLAGMLVRLAAELHRTTWPEDQVPPAELDQLADEITAAGGRLSSEATPAG